MTEQDRSYIEMTVRAAMSEFKAAVPPLVADAVRIHAEQCAASKLLVGQIQKFSQDSGGNGVEKTMGMLIKNWKTIAAAILIALSLWRSGGKITAEEIRMAVNQVQNAEK